MMSWYTQIYCSDVAQFLQAIEDTRSDFDDNMMVYRGQGDSEYKLRPTLYRRRYGDMRIEFYLLHNFILLSQRCGLLIPPDAMSYLSLGNKTVSDSLTAYSLAVGERHNIVKYDIGDIAFAMARHAGIPTRRLDFSWDPLVATYFAVQSVFEDYSHKGKEPPERLAVWAIKYNELLNNYGVIHHDWTNIPSLRNQKGLFVFDSMIQIGGYDCWTKAPPFEESLSQIGRNDIAVKIMLESTKANIQSLGKYLIRRGITKEKMFPTYKNVRDAIMRDHDKALFPVH